VALQFHTGPDTAASGFSGVQPFLDGIYGDVRLGFHPLLIDLNLLLAGLNLFLASLHCAFPRYNLKLDHDHFLPHRFQFIIHKSSYI
jgi:hypothetical protein